MRVFRIAIFKRVYYISLLIETKLNQPKNTKKPKKNRDIYITMFYTKRLMLAIISALIYFI